MNIDAVTSLWILDYLINTPQFISIICDIISYTLHANTGAPEGIALSPLFFALYTAVYLKMKAFS